MSEEKKTIRNQDLTSLKQTINESIGDFDKNIVTIAGIALGLTLTIHTALFKLQEAQCIFLLYGSWLLLALSLIIGLGTDIVQSRLSHIIYSKLDDLTDESSYLEDRKSIVNSSLWYDNIILAINWVKFIFFILGLFLFISYMIINTQTKLMQKTTTNMSADSTKSATIGSKVTLLSRNPSTDTDKRVEKEPSNGQLESKVSDKLDSTSSTNEVEKKEAKKQ